MSRCSRGKFFVSALSLGLFSCVLGACSVHPLVNDVTGYQTATIVRKIRCEARDAVIDATLEILHKNGRHPELSAATLQTLDKKSLNSWEQTKLQDLENIGIVYDFSLHGNESDNLMLSSDIINPLKHGTETFSPSLGNMTQRDNVRLFTVSDSFVSLMQLGAGKDDRHHCDFGDSPPPGPNYEYPIAGRIGLDEMVQTFVRLAVSGDLIAPEDPSSGTPTVSPAGSPTMVDTLTFTTTISAGLTPKISLTPVGTGVQLMDATLVGTASRTDTHKVVIGMAIGKSTISLSPTAVAALLTPKTTNLFFTSRAKSPNSGEALAAQAVTQYFIRTDLRRASIAIVP